MENALRFHIRRCKRLLGLIHEPCVYGQIDRDLADANAALDSGDKELMRKYLALLKETL